MRATMRKTIVSVIVIFLALMEITTCILACGVFMGDTSSLDKFSISCAFVGCTASLIGAIISLRVITRVQQANTVKV